MVVAVSTKHASKLLNSFRHLVGRTPLLLGASQGLLQRGDLRFFCRQLLLEHGNFSRLIGQGFGGWGWGTAQSRDLGLQVGACRLLLCQLLLGYLESLLFTRAK